MRSSRMPSCSLWPRTNNDSPNRPGRRAPATAARRRSEAVELRAVDALPTASAKAGEAASRPAIERLLYGPLLTFAVGACAAIPVIAAAARALDEGFQPVADRGIIATRAYDVFSS